MCVLSPPGGPRVTETGVDLFLSVTVDELLAPPRHSSSSGKGVGGELLSVIACSGCYHGAPQALGAVAGAGRALNGRKVFAHSSAGRKSKIRCCQGSPRPADGHLTASSRGRPAMSVSSSPLPRRTPAVLGEDPPHDPLCLSSLFKGSVSGLPRWSSG